MHYLRLTIIFSSILVLSACGPMAAVGAIGTTITNAAYHQAERNPPQDTFQIAVANVNLGLEYMRRGDYEKALTRLNRAKEADPDYVPTYNALGLLYQRLGETEVAESNFKKSIKLDGSDSSSLNIYGQFLCNQGREIEAREYFLTAAGNPLYETPEIPYYNAGNCAYMHNRTDLAVDYFEKALSSNPYIPAALIKMSEINFDAGDYHSARNYLVRHTKLAKHSAKSLWLGIRIERQLGDKDLVSSYALLLRNNFSDSEEAKSLSQSE